MNNLELAHRAKGLFDEIRWAAKVEQELPAGVILANRDALRQHYVKQLSHMHARLRELDDPGNRYRSKNRNRVVSKLKTAWNTAKIVLFKRKAQRHLDKIKGGLGLRNMPAINQQVAEQPEQAFERQPTAALPEAQGPPFDREHLRQLREGHDPNPKLKAEEQQEEDLPRPGS